MTNPLQKKAQLILASSILALLVGCNGNSGSNSHSGRAKAINPLCSDSTSASCMTSVDWKILLHGKSFPEKSKIAINGMVVLDECTPSKADPVLDRTADPQTLTIEGYAVPQLGQVQVEIKDLGVDCLTESVFMADTNVHFEVVKTLEDVKSIEINL